MKKSKFKAILIIGFLFLFGCAATQEVKQPPAEAPTAEFPAMKVGDSWAITGGISFEIIEVKPDGGFVTELKKTDTGQVRHYHYNNEYQIEKVYDPKANQVSYRPEQGRYQLLNFPLFVGKQWSQTLYINSVIGEMYDYLTEYKVVTYERVSTRAGKFMAFQISISMQHKISSSMLRYKYWYSPELKSIIKQKGGTNLYSWQSYQLESYKLAE